jgi:hypothetical protein
VTGIIETLVDHRLEATGDCERSRDQRQIADPARRDRDRDDRNHEPDPPEN